MEIKFSKDETVGIIQISGRLDASNYKELKNSFTQYLDEVTNFVFDMKKLNFLDSSGLGAIVSCLKKAAGADGDVYIAHLLPKPRLVFEITRAFKIFEVFDDADAAIEKMKQV